MAPQVKEFLRILRRIDHSKRDSEVFRDFCEMAYCAIAKTTAPTRERAEALEADYMRAVKRYRNPDDVRKMPELLALAATALQAGGCDFLGEIAGEIGALDAGLGQFFTPYEISRLNAELILSDAPAMIERQKFLTLQEPAAGAGGMVIAAADVLESKGIDPARHVWFDATELNGPTYQMCFIQTSLRGLSGMVRHGNTLSLETFGQSLTPMARGFLALNGDPFASQRRTLPAPPAEPPRQAATRPVQLTLF